MMRHKLVACLIAVVPHSTAAALAPTDAGPHGQQHRGGGPHGIEKIDSDHDGYISEGEHGAWAAQVLRSMDTNNDGKVSRNEYMSEQMGADPLPGWSHWRMSMSQSAKSDSFQAMDTDLDGEVNGVAFIGELDQEFRAQDKNKDGRISVEEFREWHRGW